MRSEQSPSQSRARGMVRVAGVWVLAGLLAGVACRSSKTNSAPDGGSGYSGAQGESGASGQSGGAPAAGMASGGDVGGSAVARSFLADGVGWTPVTTLPGCRTRVARDPTAVWPGFSFAPCGAGCREARVLPGDRPALAAMPGTSARVRGDELVLSMSMRTTGSRSTFVLGSFRFGEGAPLALLAEDGACIAQLGGRGSPSVFKVFAADGDLQYKLAWLSTGTAPRLEWLASLLPEPLEIFDFDTSWGGIASFADVRIAPAPGTLALSLVYESRGALRYPTGANGIAVWTEWLAPEGRIVTYSGGRAAIAAAGGWFPARLAAAKGRIAWIGATGSRAFEGIYESAALYTCAVHAEAGPCNPERGPVLPIRSSAGVLALSARWAALTGCSETDCDVYVVNLGDASVHRVSRAHDGHGVEVIGISDSELFVADRSINTVGTPDFESILRYDLAELSHFATQL